MKTASKDNDGSWVKVWVVGIVGTAPAFATKQAHPHPVTPEEQAALDAKIEAQRQADEGPGFDD